MCEDSVSDLWVNGKQINPLNTNSNVRENMNNTVTGEYVKQVNYPRFQTC